ncbi:MAG: type II toxin-antitoxin system RelE/ParE family toxin [Desulfovibrio sp.]|jgi:proteic killer suppression protein|nr:type II toxin-antitoxin system RelE/ParE family toxin [Desulfovibrio sp.]
MIKSFAHKGLEEFYLTRSTRGIQAKHSAKLALVLDLLNHVNEPIYMNFAGSGLHRLQGDMRGHWAVRISGNWRLTFRFEDGNAYVVDYQDYH